VTITWNTEISKEGRKVKKKRVIKERQGEKRGELRSAIRGGSQG